MLATKSKQKKSNENDKNLDSRRSSRVRRQIKFENGERTIIVTLADPGGVLGARAPPTPRFGGPSYTIWRPSVQFKG